MERNTLSTNLLAKETPTVFVSLNNGKGTFLYNHNMQTVFVKEIEDGVVVITENEKEATGTMIQYDSLRVEYPKTADNIFGTLLTAKYPANRESQLMNEYQSAVLGLLPESAKLPYEEFLKDRLSLRAMVDADCEKHKIPKDL